MDFSANSSVYDRLEQAQHNLRHHLCRVGLVAKWHVGSAVVILQDHSVLAHYAMVPSDTKDAYLAVLPELVREVVQQDKACTEIWASKKGLSGYPEQQRQLVDMLLRFRFRCLLYEQLGTQNLRPFFNEASKIAANGAMACYEALVLESNLRLSIAEFLKLESEISNDLRALNEVRAEMVHAYHGFAKWLAYRLSEDGTFPKAGEIAALEWSNSWPVVPQRADDLQAGRDAVRGLEKAAANFDCGIGFSFITYAQWWIRATILNEQQKRAENKQAKFKGGGRSEDTIRGMTPIYLDYNATTPIDPAVIAAKIPYLAENGSFGKFDNPSSTRAYGKFANRAVEKTRSQLAALIGAAPSEMIFTGGSTETSNDDAAL